VAHDSPLAHKEGDWHRPALAAQESFAEVVNTYARLRGQHRGLVQENLVGFGELLQTRGGGHGIARQSH
jgi:hypothetical protein